MTALETFLDEVVVPRDTISFFLDRSEPNWARYDSELGYVLRDSIQKDGLDGACTFYRYASTGERRMLNFAERPCRINTYGNSFTQCHQVSDGETWQEVLAAHFGEPIRNFGIGGHGVYQAYKRMLRHEVTEEKADYLILNIWLDDHRRNVDAWMGLRVHRQLDLTRSRNMFHLNPWDYLRIEPGTGDVLECRNVCPTPESLYNLCDRDFIYETFRDDPVVRMILCALGEEVDTTPLEALTETLGLALDFTAPETRAAAADVLHYHYAFRSTQYCIEQAQAFAAANKRKLMIFLSYPGPSVARGCESAPAIERVDQPFVDWLNENDILYVDSMAAHVADYAKFSISPTEYTNRFYIGHYGPAGNHFFAYAVKDALVEWLDPKPPAYRGDGETLRFEGFIPTL